MPPGREARCSPSLPEPLQWRGRQGPAGPRGTRSHLQGLEDGLGAALVGLLGRQLCLLELQELVPQDLRGSRQGRARWGDVLTLRNDAASPTPTLAMGPGRGERLSWAPLQRTAGPGWRDAPAPLSKPEVCNGQAARATRRCPTRLPGKAGLFRAFTREPVLGRVPALAEDTPARLLSGQALHPEPAEEGGREEGRGALRLCPPTWKTKWGGEGPPRRLLEVLPARRRLQRQLAVGATEGASRRVGLIWPGQVWRNHVARSAALDPCPLRATGVGSRPLQQAVGCWGCEGETSEGQGQGQAARGLTSISS